MSAIDTYERRKEQNKINQQNRRRRIKELLGGEEYKKDLAQKAREQYAKRKEKVDNEYKKRVEMKIGATKYANNIINDVFDKIINNIPKKETKDHQGETKKIRRRGRPSQYIIKDNMTVEEKKLVEQKLKKREYMKVYMANKRRELKTN
jgi:transposase InsO family protein